MSRGCAAALVAAACAAAAAQPAGVADALDALLAEERRWSAAADKGPLADALAGMMADDAVMMAQGARVDGHQAIRAALAADAAMTDARGAWRAVFAGVSADGQHGFTAGMMTARGTDGPSRAKYLAYWVRRGGSWRVVVYRRTRAAADAPEPGDLPPALPAAIAEMESDAAAIARAGQSLDAAERAFSDDAQRLGVGPAFARWGTAQSINLGGPATPGLLVGADAIARVVGQAFPGVPAPIRWAPDSVIVAASGDLGVTIGVIRRNPGASAALPEAVPFFTIWRRLPSGDWRYLAE
ncbi:MAG: DUF4440 domain-containing protein [Acidobacteriota bacterium]